MPTYEYKCMGCGSLFEYFQRITDEPKTVCEECGGEIKRLISGGLSPIFKGSGFYQTDYKSSGNNGANNKTENKNEKTDTTPKKEPNLSVEKNKKNDA